MIRDVPSALGLGLLLLMGPLRSGEAAAKPVVPFSLPDLAGRTWTPADLRGRSALISVWATWCAPCQAELPFLQRLHDAVAGRSDVAVLSISIDEKPADARAFVTRRHFSFPVLLGPEFVETHFLATGLGIPVSWLVDPDGMVRREAPRFDRAPNGEAWLQAVLDALTRGPSPSR
jgi:peroxiredoxin